jgi:hypothetical protein
MTEAILLGLLILALAAWSACIILFARSILPLANAFRVMHEVDKRFDERINAVLDRARANTKKPVIPEGKPSAQAQAQQIQDNLTGMFGGAPLIAPEIFGEQPEADLEVVDA